jgi:hypothetical protein
MMGNVASKASPPHGHHRDQSKVAEPGKAKDRPKGRPISELGWTPEQIAEARRRTAHLAELWDDPSMDVYDEEP